MRRTGTSARRRLTAAASVATLALLASACTGSPDDGAGDDPNAKTTLTFWHGWSAPGEVAAIKANITEFEKQHPHITVKLVKGITDDKINQGLRAGGSNAPDVVSSFTTDNVGRFCTSGALADLKPFLDKSGIDPSETFLPQMAKYTEHDGKRCTVPLLGDAYGLYYNKDAFRKAGIKAPPKTLSEFDEVAKKLTKTKGDGYEQLGFMPNYLGYETTVEHYGGQFGIGYVDKDGKSDTADDPAVKEMFTWQKNLVNDLGGYRKLNRYRTTFGDEWGAKHPFHTGQVAMQLDGEWRGKMATDAGLDFEIGAAPLPVPDDRADEYGKGYLSGTVLGIARTSEKQNAAWELVKYLSTDTDAVVSFANAIHNVPSTVKALESPKLNDDPLYRTFVDIARHPKSSHAPSSVNGGAFLLTLQDHAVAYEKGKEKDLDAMLRKNDAQVDKDNEQAQ
ncbi:sn-glycerol-3-phosphate-binding periplasmic protein UgpB precursor [Streptomyces sp. YIM 130001]|uniref:ABC transporter substrate-binding protein n=1 Tax=Streptomyces sp. YIM 130001 TaxID=2259644 RepID=UPI000E655CCB|nr:ABC transporter substrate-binding protein [Streptomyces sp. YIM 130001]RII19510.1 sn-glycerol-3-phosphate-binding periplasmic protein UgpB precursor [Streptomyces sp. YIM 130001]